MRRKGRRFRAVVIVGPKGPNPSTFELSCIDSQIGTLGNASPLPVTTVALRWYASAMQISFDIPDDIARALGVEGTDRSRLALEALALEGYRARVLFESDLCRMLGFDSRLDVHAFLKQHGVCLQYGLAEFEQDVATACGAPSYPR